MSISFSGLSSGLDTSSWVKSLTALKQAKVTTLQNKVETITEQRDALADIKSIFANFRSKLEKITDSKFNVASMDIFAKKIASSSRATAVTATAKSDAIEGSYEVKVNQLATKTQAVSGYRYKTQIVTTTQATDESYLKHIGLQSGEIQVEHEGVLSTIEINANDTMRDLLAKFDAKGIAASYNDRTGVFSFDVDIDGIWDVGLTGFVDKFNLEGINHGYKTSEQLNIEDVETVYNVADRNTLLADLGVIVGNVESKLTIEANGMEYIFALEENETMGSLVDAIAEQGIDVSFAEGVFTINNAVITNDGDTNLIDTFGLESVVSNVTQASDGMQYHTVYIETTTATEGSYIKDIDGAEFTSGDTIVVKNNSGNYTTITMDNTTTIGSLVSDMTTAGLDVTFENGSLSIDDGWIVGGTYDIESAFGLEYMTTPSIVTGSELTQTITTHSTATLDSKLTSDLGVTTGNVKIIDSSDNEYLFSVTENSTLQDFIDAANGYGLSASYNSTTGIVTLQGGRYESVTEGSDLYTVMFGEANPTTSGYAYASSVSESLVVRTTETIQATSSTALSNLGIENGQTVTFNETTTIAIDSSLTMSELVTELRNNGLDASFDNNTGKLLIEDAVFTGSTGNFASIMGFEDTIVGKYETSSVIAGKSTISGTNLASEGVVLVTTSTISGTQTIGNATTGGEIGYNTTSTVGGTQTGATMSYVSVGQATTTIETTSVSIDTTGIAQTGGVIGYVDYTVTTSATAQQGNVLTYTTTITNTSTYTYTPEITSAENIVRTVVTTTTQGLTSQSNVLTYSSYDYDSNITPATINVIPTTVDPEISLPVLNYGAQTVAHTSTAGIVNITDVGAGVANTVLINDTAGYETFIANINGGETYAGKTIVLGADVITTTTIKTTGTFSGVLDGNGYTVSGLATTMFDIIYGGSVKNLVIADSTITGNATLANFMLEYSDVRNIKLKNVEITGYGNVAGLVQNCNTGSISSITVSGCTITSTDLVEGNVTVTASGDVAGISNIFNDLTGTYENFKMENTLVITEDGNAAGIVNTSYASLYNINVSTSTVMNNGTDNENIKCSSGVVNTARAAISSIYMDNTKIYTGRGYASGIADICYSDMSNVETYFNTVHVSNTNASQDGSTAVGAVREFRGNASDITLYGTRIVSNKGNACGFAYTISGSGAKTLDNVDVIGVNISGYGALAASRICGIFGVMQNCGQRTFNGCDVSGYIYSNNGLSGFYHQNLTGANQAIFNECTVNADMQANQSISGFSYAMDNSVFTSCKVMGTLDSINACGFGMQLGTFTDCEVNADITASNITGFVSRGINNITNCKVSGNFVSNSDSGVIYGFAANIGYNTTPAHATGCIVNANISTKATATIYDFAGSIRNSSTITNSKGASENQCQGGGSYTQSLTVNDGNHNFLESGIYLGTNQIAISDDLTLGELATRQEVTYSGETITLSNGSMLVLTTDTTIGDLRSFLSDNNIILAGSDGSGNSITYESDTYIIGNLSSELQAMFEIGQGTLQTSNASSSSSLSNFSISNGTYNIETKDGDIAITVSDSTTIGDVINKLTSNNIGASIGVDGRLIYNNSGSNFVKAVDSGISVLFNCSNDAETNKGVIWQEGQAINRYSIDMNTQIGELMTSTGEVGNASGANISIVNSSGNLHTIELSSTDTLQDLADELGSCGFTLSIINNKIDITDNNNHDQAYIFSMNSDFQNAIGLSGVGSFNTTLSETTTVTSTHTATADTTLDELGLVDGSYTVQTSYPYEFAWTENGVSSFSLGDVVEFLQEANVNAFFENGRIVIRENETKNSYITNMDSSLCDILGISIGPSSYTIQSAMTQHEADGDTTLGTLGLMQDGIITFSDNSTATVNASTTIDNLVDILSDKMTSGTVTFNTTGTNAGKLTVDPADGVFIKNMSSELQSILKFNTGDGNSYQVNINQQTIQQTFTNQTMSTITATASTTFGELGFGENETGYIKLADGISINITATTSLGSFRTALSDNGINTSEITNGVISLLDTGDGIITSISSNVAGILGWNSGYNETYSTNINHNLATTATTMQTLGMTSDGVIVTNNGNITMHSSDTIDDVMSALTAKGITSSFNDLTGQFTIGDAEDTAVVTSMTSNLSSALGGISTGENLSFTTGGIEIETNISVTADMTLARLGVTEDCSITVTGDNGGVINLTSGTTVQQFINAMNSHGYTASITSGILRLQAGGNNYISDDTGNILSKFNINSPTYTINAINLGDTKITELKDTFGNDLNISTGEIGVVQNGISRTVTIESTDTLDSLAEKFAVYGVEMVYGNSNSGSIRFTTGGNTYLQSIGGGSDFLSKIDADSWNTLSNLSSQSLEYVTNPDRIITSGTKITELRASNGIPLDITTGTYKIVSNGVTVNKTITENTTLADLFSDLSQSGISASIDSNGQISLGSSSNTYLRYDGSVGESNIVDTLFSEWSFGNIYTSNYLDVIKTPEQTATRDTKLSELSSGPYNAGILNVSNQATGTVSSITLAENATIGSFMDALTLHGFTSYLNSNGQVIVQNEGNKTITSPAEGGSNALEVLGINTSNWEQAGQYGGNVATQSVEMETEVAADRNTALSDLGITEGSFYVYSNGVRHEVEMSSDETIGSLFDTLNSYGLHTTLKKDGNTSTVIIQGTGDSYIAQSNSVGASNIVEVLGLDTYKQYNYEASLQTTEYVTTTVVASNGTFVSDYNKVVDEVTQLSEGTLAVEVDGQYSEIQINSYETFGSLIEKLNRAGIKATLNDGMFQMETGDKTFSVINETTTSNILNNLGLVYDENLGDFSASTSPITQTVTTLEDRTLSVANYADMDTKLSLLNISNGTLSVYRNGKKAAIQVNSAETISDLRSKVAGAFAENDIDIKVEDGHLIFFTTGENVNIQVGSSVDSTNLSSICNFVLEDDGTISSSKELYKINSSSRIMESSIFRRSAVIGDATAGDFVIGDATFTIDENSTIAGIIAQINSSEKSNATAYWDSIDGKMVITARNTGATMLNIEAGTSNFTDLLGLTNTDRNGEGEVEVTRINREAQNVGYNANFTINGTKFSSASNVITSDISRIEGVTFNLKGITGPEAATITVEKNKEAASATVQEFVDAYNELISAVDEQVSKDGALSDQYTLKTIRNQLRNLVSGAYNGDSIYRNLSAIGISTIAANGANVSTTGLDTLYFDTDKFIQAYEKDSDSLKKILIGDEISGGILSNIESVVENALVSVSGYFASADNSFTKTIQNLNDKISRANRATELYRARLEAKFQSMDMLISQIQDQYNSFLSNSL